MDSLKLLWKKWNNGTLRDTWEEWLWIWSYGKRYTKEILFYVFLGIFGTVFSLAASILSKNLIDVVTGVQTDRIGVLVAVMIPMALVSMIASSLLSRISLKISIRVQNDIQADIYDRILSVQWLDLSRYSTGELLNRFGSDVSAVAGSAIGWFPSLVSSLVTFLLTLAVVVYYDPAMGLITLLNVPAMLISSRFSLRRMRQHTEKIKDMNGKVMQFHQESFLNLDTIKSFDLTEQFGGKLRHWQEQYRDVNLDYNAFTIKRNIVLSVLSMVVSYSIYFWCVYRLWSGEITYGEMTLFLSQGGKLASAFKGVVSIIPKTITSTISARRLMEIIRLPREERTVPANLDGKHGLTVTMKDVCFGYIPEKNVIVGGNLTAAPGEAIGLAGASGAGKTTCIRLLLGLVQPAQGQVLLSDKAGNCVESNAATRNLFSYVPQGNTVFSGTIAENLRLARPDATEEQLKAALETACAWEFVWELPAGIHTPIGQKGGGLSEGQAQRIAIARAVLRDAPILLLDEATSALDTETEGKVLDNLMKNNRTCILTTHRASTLERCSRVYRVQDGTLLCPQQIQ